MRDKGRKLLRKPTGGAEVSDANKIEAAFARLEGVVTTEIKHLSHDVKNINQKLDAYPTQRDLSAVRDRVASLEDSRSWLIKSVMWAWICGTGVVIGGVAAFLKLMN